MRKPAPMILLIILLVAVGLLSASVSDGKTVARWHSRSFDAQFTATGCGSPFEGKRRFSDSVKRLKLREPAIGVGILDPQGESVAKVSSVRVNRHRDGSREVIWQATPGLECPPRVPGEPEDPPLPVLGVCSVLSEGIAKWEACLKEHEEASRRWEAESAERRKAWEEEVSAQQQAKSEYRAIWGTSSAHVNDPHCLLHLQVLHEEEDRSPTQASTLPRDLPR